MLSFEAWFTLVVLALTFAALLKEVLAPDIVLFGALVTLWGGGVISAEEATRGFSNAQVLTVALLFVVAAAVQQTGALRKVERLMLGAGTSKAAAVGRLAVPTAALSAFLNNTPIVAMFMPMVLSWAHAHKIAPSRLLIPLSYAAILGGTCTLIGTSTNLVVSGLLEEAGHAPLGMFELSVVGVPVTVLGVLYLATIGQRLLPDRAAPDDPAPPGEARSYSVSVHVGPTWAGCGKPVEEAGLRHLEGLFLVEIRRADQRIYPVRPTDRIEANDDLIFYGRPETVVELLAINGLTADDGSHSPQGPSPNSRIHEIVIRQGSGLIGSTLRELNFRRAYDAAVIGIYRDGERLRSKLGDVRLRAYDTLLVQSAVGFRKAWADSKDFYLLSSPLEGELAGGHTLISLLILVAMVGLMGSGLVSPLLAAAAAAVLMVVSRCIEPGQARRAVDLSVLVVVASAFGLSAAVEKSGLATLAAQAVQSALGDSSPWLALAAVYLLCAVVTELLSNSAAAALVLPVALSVAEVLEVDPRPFALTVCVAASLSFVTPLGYQTNLLIYSPGGYRFTDFTRVGLPLALICFVVTVGILALGYGL